MTPHELKIFAGHVGEIHRMKESDEAQFTCAKGMTPIRIHRTHALGYYVSGIWAGNACGAAAEYARLVGEYIIQTKPASEISKNS